MDQNRRRNRPRRAALVSFFVSGLVATVPLIAFDVVGTVRYLEGTPELVRDGAPLLEGVDFGSQLENFDAVITDGRSSLEFVTDASTGIDVTVTVQPSTRLYIDMTSLRADQDATVELAAGSVRVVARRLSARSRFSVITPTAVLGVRGTTFTVAGGPAGEVLVVTDEGLVEVTDENGQVAFAAPGEAVEVDPEDRVMVTRRYARERTPEFVDEWRAERRERLLGHAERLLPIYAERYVAARARFIGDYGELMRRRDVFDRWMEEGRRGLSGSPLQQIREAREISRLIAQIRLSARAFEHLLDRLSAMAVLVAGTPLDRDPHRGLFRQVENDRRIMNERLATVRYVFKLYSQRNAGIVPRFLTDGE